MNRAVTKSRCALLALAGILALATSCATNQQAAGPKFYEESAANLVIRYASDQAIFRLKPDGHDGPYYHVFNRQQLCEADARRAGQRDLAVVLIGWQWTPELDQKVKQGWVDSLAKLNYRRVVILRAGETDQVNGLRVIEDRQVAQAAVAPHEIGLVSAAPSQLTAR
jgi:hypothetical protein